MLKKDGDITTRFLSANLSAKHEAILALNS